MYTRVQLTELLAVCFFVNAAGAILTGGPKNTAGRIGSSVQFTCSSTGKTSSICWARQTHGSTAAETINAGQTVVPGLRSRFYVTTDTNGTRSTLTINSILTTDAGIYYCRECLNSTKLTAQLTVLECGAYQKVALNRRAAVQVSTYTYFVASRAVDGYKSTTACTQSFTRNAWWSVDLGELTNVVGVNVTNSANPNHPQRLDNFVVGLTNSSPDDVTPEFKANYNVCRQYSGRVPVGATVYMPCPDLPPARYVIIQSSQWSEALCLAEVEVYVYVSNQCCDPNCADVCNQHGPGKCDRDRTYGYGLDQSDHTCKRVWASRSVVEPVRGSEQQNSPGGIPMTAIVLPLVAVVILVAVSVCVVFVRKRRLVRRNSAARPMQRLPKDTGNEYVPKITDIHDEIYDELDESKLCFEAYDKDASHATGQNIYLELVGGGAAQKLSEDNAGPYDHLDTAAKEQNPYQQLKTSEVNDSDVNTEASADQSSSRV